MYRLATEEVLHTLPGVRFFPDGVAAELTRDWCASGEDHLSHVTLLYLAECVRERHWREISQGFDTDLIGREMQGRFRNPVRVPGEIEIRYRVTRIWRRGYDLAFTLGVPGQTDHLTTIDLRCAFYDPAARASVVPPPALVARLSAACAAPPV